MAESETSQATPDAGACPSDAVLSQSEIVAAHTQRTTLHIVEAFPDHTPRASDIHYRFFNAAHARLKKLGKLVCWINNADCAGQIELHHTICEFALANGVDVAHFEQLYPEFGITTDEQFLEWVEGPENLTPLCLYHHRGNGGVHCLPGPIWLPQRFWRAGLVAPAHVETAKELAAGSVTIVPGDGPITVTLEAAGMSPSPVTPTPIAEVQAGEEAKLAVAIHTDHAAAAKEGIT